MDLQALLKKKCAALTADELRFIISNCDDERTVEAARSLLIINHFSKV